MGVANVNAEHELPLVLRLGFGLEDQVAHSAGACIDGARHHVGPQGSRYRPRDAAAEDVSGAEERGEVEGFGATGDLFFVVDLAKRDVGFAPDGDDGVVAPGRIGDFELNVGDDTGPFVGGVSVGMFCKEVRGEERGAVTRSEPQARAAREDHPGGVHDTQEETEKRCDSAEGFEGCHGANVTDSRGRVNGQEGSA